MPAGEPIIVSNSEALAWLRCRRQYYYNYDLALEPVIQPGYFFKGNLVHAAHERYYKALQGGQGHDGAVVKGNEAFSLALEKDTYGNNLGDIGTLKTVMKRYWNEVAANDNWDILAVEKNYNLPLTPEFSFGFTPDLIAKIDGLVTVVDHKNVYDFWHRRELDLDPQSRKYMAALIGLGKGVDRVMHNQTRYRLLKTRTQATEELFRRDYATPNADERRGMISEQIKVTMQVAKHRKLDIEARERESLRVLNKQVCERCIFAELCYTELRGGNIQTMIEVDFKPNTYVTKHRAQEGAA
jgi:hypothetical protein